MHISMHMLLRATLVARNDIPGKVSGIARACQPEAVDGVGSADPGRYDPAFTSGNRSVSASCFG
jgi:hypothetical protein